LIIFLRENIEFSNELVTFETYKIKMLAALGLIEFNI